MIQSIFGFSEAILSQLGATYTATEIHQQPAVWRKCFSLFQSNKTTYQAFMDRVLAIDNLKIILTGAGTSAYVGDTIAIHLSNQLGKPVISLPTTDAVSNPNQYIDEDVPTLLVSFARSGNSPESVGTYDVFEQKVKNLYQLVITCNKEGELAKKSSTNPNNLVILMPAECNDKSFAMTSSFTSMLLSSLLIFDLANLDQHLAIFQDVLGYADTILETGWEDIKAITELNYNRIVYLGSGVLKGLCNEMALKNLELTSGKYVTVNESVLGFRHGPKSIINDETIVIVLTSNDDHTFLYDYDLIKKVNKDTDEQKVIT